MEISAAIANSVASNLLLLPRLSLSATSAVRSDTCRSSSAPRALLRRSRRTRRKSLDANSGDDLLSGDGDDGPFGGGNGGFGGRWNFGGGDSGGWGWEENDESGDGSSSDPAFDFVYEVVLWVALSNCTHFAVKKLGRIFEERGKVEPVRLVPSIC